VLALPYIRLDTPERGCASAGRAETWRFPPNVPEWVLTCEAPNHALLHTSDGVEQQWDDPLEALSWMVEHVTMQHSSRLRWVGYLSYDLGRLFEQLPSRAADDLSLPLFRFSLQYLSGEVPHDLQFDPAPASQALRSTFAREAYIAAVERAIEYISAGDLFQVNLSQRFTAPLREHPAKLYARLRRQSPAWYGACLCYEDFAILSNSPELFLRVEPPDTNTGKRRVVTRPIKGTRPKLPGMSGELLESSKDAAELNMIVDLERNDLGRVCEIGSVKVTEARTVEPHPSVYHGVATIEGVLRDDVTLVDLLRATFPGGSVTGAPKIRAMQIIDELEPVSRGPYCGAIGYIGGDGAVEFNVAIRTMTVKDGLVHVPVGGGIVADSDPAAEYEETLVKARAMFAAVGASAADLPR
jgi:anthranilate/para-aminobenzoate synthase component I